MLFWSRIPDAAVLRSPWNCCGHLLLSAALICDVTVRWHHAGLRECEEWLMPYKIYSYSLWIWIYFEYYSYHIDGLLHPITSYYHLLPAFEGHYHPFTYDFRYHPFCYRGQLPASSRWRLAEGPRHQIHISETLPPLTLFYPFPYMYEYTNICIMYIYIYIHIHIHLCMLQ